MNPLQLGPHEGVLLQGLSQHVSKIGQQERWGAAVTKSSESDSGGTARQVAHSSPTYGCVPAQSCVVAHHVSHELLRVLQLRLEPVSVGCVRSRITSSF